MTEEREIILLRPYSCDTAKGDMRIMFSRLRSLLEAKGRDKTYVLDAVGDSTPEFRELLFERGAFRRYFTPEERKILDAYWKSIRESSERERAKKYLESVDLETFANLVRKIAEIEVSWGCFTNVDAGRELFKKEFETIKEYFEKWIETELRGVIDYSKFEDKVIDMDTKMDDKLSDLAEILGGGIVEEERVWEEELEREWEEEEE